jgi:hypothetical protein
MIEAQIGEGHAYQNGVNMGGMINGKGTTDTRSV